MLVLVVEDVIDYAEAIKRCLEKRQHAAIIETEPDLALALLKQENFDGVICAAYFASKDPMDFLANVTKHSKFSKLPFIMYAQAETVSGHRLLRAVGQAALQLGASSFIALEQFSEEAVCEKFFDCFLTPS